MQNDSTKRLFAGWFGSQSKASVVNPKDVKSSQITRATISPAVPTETTSVNFTIFGTRKQDIDAVKQNIDKCCAEESAEEVIQGSEYSDIIKLLDQREVNF